MTHWTCELKKSWLLHRAHVFAGYKKRGVIFLQGTENPWILVVFRLLFLYRDLIYQSSSMNWRGKKNNVLLTMSVQTLGICVGFWAICHLCHNNFSSPLVAQLIFSLCPTLFFERVAKWLSRWIFSILTFPCATLVSYSPNANQKVPVSPKLLFGLLRSLSLSLFFFLSYFLPSLLLSDRSFTPKKAAKTRMTHPLSRKHLWGEEGGGGN